MERDIFADMQARIGCRFLSDLPCYKRAVWFELKRLPLVDYGEKQLEDFSRYVFGVRFSILKAVMEQIGKGSEQVCRKCV